MCCEGRDLNSLPEPELAQVYRFHGKAASLRDEDPNMKVYALSGEPDEILVHHAIRLGEIVDVGESNFGPGFIERAFKDKVLPPILEGPNF